MRSFLNFARIRTEWPSPPSWLGGFMGFLLISLAIIFGLLFLGVIIIFCMTLFGSLSEDLQNRAESVRNVGLVIAAFVGFPFLIWRTLVASNQAQTSSEALFNDKITHAANDLAARKQLSHVSEQDGVFSVVNEWQDDAVVRSMAIHRLEGLANERPEFSPRISRMLASYIRGNFSASNLDPTLDLKVRSRPRMDLQDAVDALGRILKFAINYEEGNWRVDLTNTNFDGVNLGRGYFRAVNFSRSRFEAAILDAGNFQGAWFYEALLNHATFAKADFTGAHLNYATYNLPNIQAGGFNLAMGQAELKGVDFSGADISACTHIGGPNKISKTFGNADTKLYRRLHPKKPSEEELNTAYIFRSGSKEREYTEEQKAVFKKVDESGFQNWSPYKNNDGANYHIKLELMDKLGLNMWPYTGL